MSQNDGCCVGTRAESDVDHPQQPATNHKQDLIVRIERSPRKNTGGKCGPLLPRRPHLLGEGPSREREGWHPLGAGSDYSIALHHRGPRGCWNQDHKTESTKQRPPGRRLSRLGGWSCAELAFVTEWAMWARLPAFGLGTIFGVPGCVGLLYIITSLYIIFCECSS